MRIQGILIFALLAAFQIVAEESDPLKLIEQLSSNDRKLRGDAQIRLYELARKDERVTRALEAASKASGRGAAAFKAAQIISRLKLDLNELTQQLKDPNGQVRQQTAQRLMFMGALACDAVDALIAAMQDKDRMVSYHAARALGAIGPRAKNAVPALIAYLKDSTDVRGACEAFEGIGEDAKEAIPFVVPYLQSPEPEWAARALFAMGFRDVKSLLSLINDPDPKKRISGMKAVGEFWNSGAEAVPAVLAIMKENNPETTTVAIETLGRIAGDNRKAKEALAALLKNKDALLARMALRAISTMGTRAADLAAQLIICLETPDLHSDAWNILSRMGGDSIPLVLAALKHNKAEVREGALCALGRSIGTSKPALDAMLAAMRDQAAATRRTAAFAVGTCLPPVRATIPGLASLLEDKNDEVVEASMRALENYRWNGGAGDEVIPGLIKILRNGDLPRRAQASGIYPRTATGLAQLLPLFKDANPEIRQYAIEAMHGTAEKSAIPSLLEALNDPVAKVRTNACIVLSSIGELAKEAESAVVKLTKDKDPEVRVSALFALVAIAPSSAKTNEAIQSAQNDSHPGVKHSAGQAAQLLRQTHKQ